MVPATARVAAAEDRTLQAPVLALARQLDDLIGVLIVMRSEDYVARPAPGVSGSIGEHVRHVLDHIGALLAADPRVPLSYDRRERGTAVESDVSTAMRQILRLKAALERWSTRSLDDPILVEALVSRTGPSVAGWSSLARELAFVFSHTVHHMSTIALLMDLQDLHVPERFGYAPSTPAPR
jgi:uncharacterized damage-inducible protein DinB